MSHIDLRASSWAMVWPRASLVARVTRPLRSAVPISTSGVRRPLVWIRYWLPVSPSTSWPPTSNWSSAPILRSWSSALCTFRPGTVRSAMYIAPLRGSPTVLKAFSQAVDAAAAEPLVASSNTIVVQTIPFITRPFAEKLDCRGPAHRQWARIPWRQPQRALGPGRRITRTSLHSATALPLHLPQRRHLLEKEARTAPADAVDAASPHLPAHRPIAPGEAAG